MIYAGPRGLLGVIVQRRAALRRLLLLAQAALAVARASDAAPAAVPIGILRFLVDLPEVPRR